MVDLIILNGCYLAIALPMGGDMTSHLRLVWLILNFSYLVVLYFRLDIHERRVMYADHVAMHAFKSALLHAGCVFSVLAFLGIVLPYKEMLYFYVLFTMALTLWWIVSRKILKAYRNRGFNYRNIVVVGNGAVVKRFVDEVLGDMGYGYRIVGLYGCDKDFHPELEHGGIENFADDLLTREVDEVYCAIPDNDSNGMSGILRAAEDNAIDFYYLPQLGPTVTRNFMLIPFGNVPVLSVRPIPSHNVLNRIAKRTFDIVVSLIAVILSPVVFIPVAIAIKTTSRGPVLFKQRRTGYRGKAFNCLKFRTMEVNSDNGEQVKRDDPKVTGVGRFLRHYSIDELPQFFNVLIGDMSIVGPRPHMEQHTEQYRKLIDKYMLRHVVKPGITGWAQVRGYRGGTDELWMMEKRVECDVWYTENWNFMLDLKIIFLTIINVVKGDKNAY